MILREAAGRLQQAMRQSDLIARVGGDEFCILVNGDAPADAARSVADKLVQVCSEPLRFGNATVTLGASIGIAVPDGASLPEVLLRRADEAMYKAKREGGNRYCLAE